MKNKMVDLRNHLFVALEALNDMDKPIEIERVKTVAFVAQVLVNSAKVEVDYLRSSGTKRGTGFFPDDPEVLDRLTLPSKPVRG